mmetsp:Transcript_53154/g.137341  ORF Transcript_53154/g.137341 Transcript_53154/m.137341 type:complete len:301 (-) Transcript_53154:305-1207(-)
MCRAQGSPQGGPASAAHGAAPEEPAQGALGGEARSDDLAADCTSGNDAVLDANADACEISMTPACTSQAEQFERRAARPYVPRFMRERQVAADCTTQQADKGCSAKRLYVPRYIRERLKAEAADAAKDLFSSTDCKGVDMAAGPPDPLRSVDRSLSTSSTVSVASSITSLGSTTQSCTSLRVHFSDPNDDEDVHVEVCEVVQLTRTEIVGCEADGTHWQGMAEHRAERLCLRLHSSNCRHKGHCCGVPGQGICTLGGTLAADFAIGLQEAFAAWRVLSGIPCTVSMQLLKRGVTWSKHQA